MDDLSMIYSIFVTIKINHNIIMIFFNIFKYLPSLFSIIGQIYEKKLNINNLGNIN